MSTCSACLPLSWKAAWWGNAANRTLSAWVGGAPPGKPVSCPRGRSLEKLATVFSLQDLCALAWRSLGWPGVPCGPFAESMARGGINARCFVNEVWLYWRQCCWFLIAFRFASLLRGIYLLSSKVFGLLRVRSTICLAKCLRMAPRCLGSVIAGKGGFLRVAWFCVHWSFALDARWRQHPMEDVGLDGGEPVPCGGKRIVPSFFGLVLAHSISCVVAVWHMEIVPLLTVEERSSNILLRAMQFAFAGKVLLSGGPVLPGFGSRTATQADPGCNACPRCAMAMICFEVHSATRPFFSCSSPPKNFSPNFFGCLGPGRVASRCTVWTPI